MRKKIFFLFLPSIMLLGALWLVGCVHSTSNQRIMVSLKKPPITKAYTPVLVETVAVGFDDRMLSPDAERKLNYVAISATQFDKFIIEIASPRLDKTSGKSMNGRRASGLILNHFVTQHKISLSSLITREIYLRQPEGKKVDESGQTIQVKVRVLVRKVKTIQEGKSSPLLGDTTANTKIKGGGL